jgi:hypothetical protein
MAVAAGEGHVERAVGNVVGSDKLKAEGAAQDPDPHRSPSLDSLKFISKKHAL